MKITVMAMMAVLAGASAHADEAQQNAEQSVTVCMENSNSIV